MNVLRTLRILLACLMASCSPASAAADGSQLRLPDGVDLAIVVFEDLQCPDCRNAHPYLVEAARSNDVPLMFVASRGAGATRAVEVKDARDMDAAVRQAKSGG